MVLRTPRRATAAADHPRSGASAVGGFSNDRLRLGIGRRFTPHPILLDLDGNGIRITEQSRSGMFVDAGGDGLKHRTAWAGAGDGVLFYDPDGTGAITEKRQYVFTEWGERRKRNGPGDRFRQRTRRAPTATDDLAALRSVFDSNGDGVLNASDELVPCHSGPHCRRLSVVSKGALS